MEHDLSSTLNQLVEVQKQQTPGETIWRYVRDHGGYPPKSMLIYRNDDHDHDDDDDGDDG